MPVGLDLIVGQHLQRELGRQAAEKGVAIVRGGKADQIVEQQRSDQLAISWRCSGMRRSSAADGNGRWKKNAQAFSSPCSFSAWAQGSS